MPDLGGWPRLALVGITRFAWTAAAGLGLPDAREGVGAASVLAAGGAAMAADGRAAGAATMGAGTAAAGVEG
jgi:hypothetical protein